MQDLRDTVTKYKKALHLGDAEDSQGVQFIKLSEQKQSICLYMMLQAVLKGQDALKRNLSESWEPRKEWIRWLEIKCDELIFDPVAPQYMYSSSTSVGNPLTRMVIGWMRENTEGGVDSEDTVKVGKVKALASRKLTVKKANMKAILTKVKEVVSVTKAHEFVGIGIYSILLCLTGSNTKF